MTSMNQFFGKYRGIVEDNVDPNGRGRLIVRVPSVFNEGQVWALPSVPYAGPGVGFLAVPPKKAHVWIEFECGDPRSPIWSGCFWDENESAPTKEAEQKIFKTKNCTLMLDETEGEKGGVTIEMGDAKIRIDPNKIEISRGSMSIKINGSSVSINGDALEVS
jgi:Type VI secretion system/phage-baseplate injector OB domain